MRQRIIRESAVIAKVRVRQPFCRDVPECDVLPLYDPDPGALVLYPNFNAYIN